MFVKEPNGKMRKTECASACVVIVEFIRVPDVFERCGGQLGTAMSLEDRMNVEERNIPLKGFQLRFDLGERERVDGSGRRRIRPRIVENGRIGGTLGRKGGNRGG